MSRGGRDEADREPSREDDGPSPQDRHISDRHVERSLTHDRWSAARDLTLPRTPVRQHLQLGRDRFRLRDTDTEILATIGTFRVVAERDLTGPHSEYDVRSLADQGLVESRTITINGASEPVLVLTQTGRDLLERHRGTADAEGRQEFYAGLVKPRELAHDAQLYRLFETERNHLEDTGARITRVVLDYELKREYHAYVHRQKRVDITPADARETFAREHDLPFRRGHIELPDIRIEYETRNGEYAHRDLELATEHYSRSQLSGKQAAGFRVYRAAGARGGTGTRKGGTPTDPHHLEWLR